MMNVTNPSKEDPLEDFHRERSNFVRELVQNTGRNARASSTYLAMPPRRIVQFWNDIDGMPIDVKECIESWTKLEEKGFELLLFGECQAREFIRNRLGTRYEKAFDKCYHPAMQSDYFRLCYIFIDGGFYVDADDVFRGVEVEHLFSDGRLKIQPLCYDVSTDEMVPISVFTSPGANSLNWIFYFNNNPLIATRSHPIIERALLNATTSLEQYSLSQLPGIQSTTGPGNLSRSIFDFACGTGDIEKTLLVLYDWEDIAITRWALSYRNDERNWRLSDRKVYRLTGQASVEEEG
jgi:hypothetical protein